MDGVLPILLTLALTPLPSIEAGPVHKPLPAPSLPPLELPLPGVRQAVFLTNGHITVAHVLMEAAPAPANRLLEMAKGAVRQAFQVKEGLAEVDVSLYAAPYQGPEGPLPLLTASVPKGRLEEFLRLGFKYDRLWLNPSLGPPRLGPDLEAEAGRVFQGPKPLLVRERVEQTLASRLGPRGGVIYHGDPATNRVALTFDDAPHPLFTPLLLDTLAQLHLRATFFVIGWNAVAYPYFVRDLVQAGHDLGNHTFHHLRLPKLPPDEIREEISACSEVLYSLTQERVRYFRPPGGRYSREVLRIARELGLTTVFWTDNPGDYQNLPEDTLKKRLFSRLRPGGIVLLHDNVVGSLHLLPRLAHLAQEKGLALGTVTHLVSLQAQR